MQIGPLRLGVVVDPFYGENCYIGHVEGDSRCLIVDPSFDPESILGYLAEHQLSPEAILNTHGHADHIAGNEALKAKWPDCPLLIGHGDADKLTDPVGNLSRPFGIDIVSPPADQTLREGESISLAGCELEVFETPGHSRGHIIFLYKTSSPWVVLGGDVLFRRSIGRTDFPDGSFEELERSIRTRLYTLPDDTIVLPGHGEPTTIGEEKRENPHVPG